MQLSAPEKRPSPFPRILLSVFLLLAVAGAGGLYWFLSGRQSFEGSVENGKMVPAGQGGLVANIAVTAGQSVRKGQILLYFDTSSQHKALAAEQNTLQQLARMLPPDSIYLPAPDGGMENLTQRLERQRADERVAELAVQEASDQEASLSITYSRMSILLAQGKLNFAQVAAAEKALEEAELAKREAKKHFEGVSLQRSGTSTEIRRLREAQVAAGADRIPVQERLAAYDKQRARVDGLAASLGALAVTAPMDGIILTALARPGDTLAPGVPAFIMQPAHALPAIRAELSEREAAELKPGQQCLISLPEQGGSELKGYIASLTPGPSPASVDVSVEMLPAPGSRDNRALLAQAGAKAGVTVLLREPPYSAPAPEAALPQAAAETAPLLPALPAEADVRAVPPASPLSVETPFGRPDAAQAPEQATEQAPAAAEHEQAPAPVPVVKAGSPEAGGKAPAESEPPVTASPPQLPPMKAPYPLKGSPLPEAGNNPSIVPPLTLDPAEARP